MRKKVLFIISLFSISALSAQNIHLLDASGTIVNGDTITFTHYLDTLISQSAFHHDQFVTVVNATTTDTMDIDLARQEIDPIPGSADFYCWGSECKLAKVAGSFPYWQALDPVYTEPQDSAGGLAPLSIYIDPRGNDGVSLLKFIFEDQNDRTGNNIASVFVRWVIIDTTVYSNPLMLFSKIPRKFVTFGDTISREVSVIGDTINFRSILNNDVSQTPLFEEEILINVFNATNNAMQIDMSREEITTIPRSGDYFSWNGTTTPETKAGTSPQAAANSVVAVAPRWVANKSFPIKLFLKSDSVGGTAIYKYTFTDTNDPNNKSSVFVKWTVDNITSINEAQYKNEFSLYPNPAADLTTISLEKPLVFKQQELEIYNILGEEVQSEQIVLGSQIINVDVSALTPGVYFVNIIGDGNRVASKKMIVK
ncbi:MAG: T9SS type A sorting domain-containing protein [Flavobacteriales bacterium]|nr:T9SS type A sorting domain-containing protein [Flavobacteriales bacterium]